MIKIPFNDIENDNFPNLVETSLKTQGFVVISKVPIEKYR